MTVSSPDQIGASLRTSELPASVETALDQTGEWPDRATLIEDDVHYDTDKAECIGWGVEEQNERLIYRGLYRGQNGRYFRHRVDRVSKLHSGGDGHESSVLGLLLGGLFGIVLSAMAIVFHQSIGLENDEGLLLAMLGVCYGSAFLGLLSYPAFIFVRKKLYALMDWTVPTTVEDQGIEPLSCTDLLSEPKSEVERRAARGLRDKLSSWKGSTGSVVALPDGSYLYEAGRTFTCNDREHLRELIEKSNDLELHRAVFENYDEA